MMCKYGPAEGVLLNHSYMHGVCGSISSQYAVTGVGESRPAVNKASLYPYHSIHSFLRFL